MVKAGEHGGLLAEILDRLAGFLEASARLRKKVKSAMTYPVIVICIAFAITTFLIVRVVPIFGEIFKDFGAKLPAPTQFLIDVSDFIRGEWYFLVPGIGGTILRRPHVFALDPRQTVVRPLEAETAGLRSARAQDLHVAFLAHLCAAHSQRRADSGSARHRRRLFRQSRGRDRASKASAPMWKKATTFPSRFRRSIFPPMMLRMVAAGEATGKIDTMLEKMADFWDEEIEAMLDALTSLIEPLLIVFPRRDRRRHRDRDVPADLQAERSSFAKQEQLRVVSQSKS